MKPDLTVCIPVYNESRFIADTLASLASQKFPFECLISDNASSDDSYEICLQYVRGDSRFAASRQKVNIGALANLKDLLSSVDTQFCMILGAHDLLGPGYFEQTLPVIANDKLVSMAFGIPYAIPESGTEAKPIDSGVYSFDEESGYKRYLQSIIALRNCTCVHSIFRKKDIVDFEFRKTISCDHVFISHLLWKGRLRYQSNARYFRRYFSGERDTTQEERISGDKNVLYRNDFFSYYLDSFKGLSNSKRCFGSYHDHKLLQLLEKRWGTQALFMEDQMP